MKSSAQDSKVLHFMTPSALFLALILSLAACSNPPQGGEAADDPGMPDASEQTELENVMPSSESVQTGAPDENVPEVPSLPTVTGADGSPMPSVTPEEEIAHPDRTSAAPAAQTQDANS